LRGRHIARDGDAWQSLPAMIAFSKQV
jgi:hypothetical protein